jgi:hypothetical protein
MGGQTTSRTQQNPPKAQFTGLSAEQQALTDNLLKLRGVLILLAAPRGSKATTARNVASELKAARGRGSTRALYHWRGRYLRSGFAGIARRRRNDRDCPRGFGYATLVRIVDAATRVKRYGDLAREFRNLHVAISDETFRQWVRRIQKQLRVIEMPVREGSDGMLL